jgi:hypothetical protein
MHRNLLGAIASTGTDDQAPRNRMPGRSRDTGNRIAREFQNQNGCRPGLIAVVDVTVIIFRS